MDFMATVKRMSHSECREMGELLVALSEQPRDAAWETTIEAAMEPFKDPEQQSLKEIYDRLTARDEALNNGFRSDGMNHEHLIAEELKRRGDTRTVEGYCQSFRAAASWSDVIHGNFVQD